MINGPYGGDGGLFGSCFLLLNVTPAEKQIKADHHDFVPKEDILPNQAERASLQRLNPGNRQAIIEVRNRHPAPGFQESIRRQGEIR